MNKKTTIAVGMSGGVDSSAAAYLLKKQGYSVIGLFMKNWEEKDEKGVCLAARDFEDAAAVCEKINIPCYTVNFSAAYKKEVFTDFLAGLKKGLTPNPDILCNKKIKFNLFLKKAKSLGANFLATGHYCQKDSLHNLLKGADPDKDQSYFLYTLKKETLKEILFPIGHLLKSKVRQIAKEANLPTFAKKESMGICFIGKRRFTPFLSQFLGKSPGNFENLKGEIIGRHIGLPYYTIGQRKGLKIGGRGEAWFVVGKDKARNAVIVEQGADHPALFSSFIKAFDLNWIANPPKCPYFCHAKVRYRQKEQPCIIKKIEKSTAHVEFSTPQRAATPGQSIVFYDNNICLGGGIINEVSQT